jgi:hypothetical protein
MLVDFADGRERVGQGSDTSGLTDWRDIPALFEPSHLLRLKFLIAAGLTSTRLHWIKGVSIYLKPRYAKSHETRTAEVSRNVAQIQSQVL